MQKNGSPSYTLHRAPPPCADLTPKEARALLDQAREAKQAAGVLIVRYTDRGEQLVTRLDERDFIRTAA